MKRNVMDVGQVLPLLSSGRVREIKFIAANGEPVFVTGNEMGRYAPAVGPFTSYAEETLIFRDLGCSKDVFLHTHLPLTGQVCVLFED